LEILIQSVAPRIRRLSITRRRKKHRPDEIVPKPRDADAMLNAGKDLAAVLPAFEMGDSTLKRIFDRFCQDPALEKR